MQAPAQYVAGMHGSGMGHGSMQSMYNSTPQPAGRDIPGHMHPHSRSYPINLNMSHHTMMDQVTTAVDWSSPKCYLQWSWMSNSMQLPSCAAAACMNRVSSRRPAFHTGNPQPARE